MNEHLIVKCIIILSIIINESRRPQTEVYSNLGPVQLICSLHYTHNCIDIQLDQIEP